MISLLSGLKNELGRNIPPERQDVSPHIGQVYLELSTHCNFLCETCMRRHIPGFVPAHFEPALMDVLLPMLKRLPGLERVVLLGFGESMMNPHFEQLLRRLRKLPADLVLVSNASLFTDESDAFIAGLPVDELWISRDDPIDGGGASIRGRSDGALFRRRVESVVGAKRSGGGIKKIGMEFVATKRNIGALSDVVSFAARAGVDEFIISNVFPYSETMKSDILYSLYGGLNTPNPRSFIPRSARTLPIRFPEMIADRPRRCPFVERGTVFITASGEVAPCPELAYTHPAFYFGSRRLHSRHVYGTITARPLEEIWGMREFVDFRDGFRYFEFPDCATCWEPDLCWNRTVDWKDCFGYTVPCGECLWARGIVLCP